MPAYILPHKPQNNTMIALPVHAQPSCIAFHPHLFVCDNVAVTGNAGGNRLTSPPPTRSSHAMRPVLVSAAYRVESIGEE